MPARRRPGEQSSGVSTARGRGSAWHYGRKNRNCPPSGKHSPPRRDALKGAAQALTAGAASWPLRAIAGAESEPEEVRLAQAGPGSADTITRPLIERGGPQMTKGLRLRLVEANPRQDQLPPFSVALHIAAFRSVS